MNKKVKIEVSARHIHLKKEDFEQLFGKSTSLTVMKNLSQPGMFAANEIVEIKNEHFSIRKVRIVGPLRDYTQIEISETEARKFKINPPLRKSGDIENTPGITIIGPAGKVNVEYGVIIAKRHFHMTPNEAKEIEVKDGDLLNIEIKGDRGLIFGNVVARVNENYAWAVHIDTDESNASGMKECRYGDVLIKKI